MLERGRGGGRERQIHRQKPKEKIRKILWKGIHKNHQGKRKITALRILQLKQLPHKWNDLAQGRRQGRERAERGRTEEGQGERGVTRKNEEEEREGSVREEGEGRWRIRGFYRIIISDFIFGSFTLLGLINPSFSLGGKGAWDRAEGEGRRGESPPRKWTGYE